MKILLSIKPQFVGEIISGSKTFEYRKVMFKRKDVSKVVVYASFPICKIVGEFEVDNILCESPDQLWSVTCHSAGISKDYFFEYFSGKTIAYAIKIKTFHLYGEPIMLQEKYPGIMPPQSFRYVE